MDIRLDSLIAFEKVETNMGSIFNIVEKNGKVVLLKDNQPVYIILKYDEAMTFQGANAKIESYTLHEAMKVVLKGAKDNTMHAAALADELFNRKLYSQKSGAKAQYNQIRARCGHYAELFEVLKDNYIKLK